ncbi:MAG: radical SAM protein [Syntrophobacteraceae bacterium]|nr:radical SAM protein [Syntrophobacteraceae bacterium]
MPGESDHGPINSNGKAGAGRPLRIALLFPPAVLPTSPPLGIASLKAWLERAGSGRQVEVRNFDLNLAYFEQAVRWLGDGRLRMSLRKMEFETTARKVREAVDFLRGKEGEAFFDPGLYDEHAAVYTGFGSVLNGLFDNFARKILLGLPIPALVGGFFEELLGPVKAFEPDLAGFSILFSQQLFFALALAKLGKGWEWEAGSKEQEAGSKEWEAGRVGPGAPADQGLVCNGRSVTRMAFGGATFSVMPHPGRLLASIPVCVGQRQGNLDAGTLIDYLLVGEGEKGLEALVKSDLCPNGGVPGLVYKKDGKIVTNPAQGVSDLGELPLPDFSDMHPDRYHSPMPVLPYLSSRGCPWRRCAFCTHQKTYLHYREEDATATAQKISMLRERYGATHFCLVDEMLHPRRLDKISGELLLEDAQVFFSAYARPSGFSPNVFEKAHRAGLRLLMWGVESASRRVLDLMGKGTNPPEVKTVLHSAHQAGIWNLLFVIFGFPTETKAEWLTTLDFLDSCRESIYALSRSRFILLEGSKVFLDPARYGISRIIDRPQRDPVSIAYDYEVTEGLTVEEAAGLFRESLARLSGAGRSPWFGQLREHMLLYASRSGESVNG